MDKIAITGIGIITHKIDNFSLLKSINLLDKGTKRLVERTIKIEGISKNEIRRLSNLSKYSLYAAHQAIRYTKINNNCGICMGLTHGATYPIKEFHDYFFDYGPSLASPNSFSNSVNNAALGAVSFFLKIKQGGITLLGYENIGIDVLNYSYFTLINKEYDSCLAGCSEEYSDLINEVYKKNGWLNENIPDFLPWIKGNKTNKGFGYSEGSVFFIMEHFENCKNKDFLCFYSDFDILKYDGNADVIICGSGGGMQDVFELKLLKKLGLKHKEKKPALIFSRPFFGEAFGLGSMFACAMACDIIANKTIYPCFPINPELAPYYTSITTKPAKSVLVVCAGRNGQISSCLFYR
jgi:hypothetical protein